MVTRVSSGAIKHKSVSEILDDGAGFAPTLSQPSRPTAPISAQELDGKAKETQRSPEISPRTRRSNAAPSPGLHMRKHRIPSNKQPTVVFPTSQQAHKRQRTSSAPSLVSRTASAPGTSANWNNERDYLFLLFHAKAHLPPRSPPLSSLLATAKKTLSTTDLLLDYEEQMRCRSLKRIYLLQSTNAWPLRQIARVPEPTRQPTHWDVLLDHAKWMATDFREERKWKIAAAKQCAEWCKEYVDADEQGKAQLRVRARIPPREQVNSSVEEENRDHGRPEKETSMDVDETASQRTPSLVSSHGDESDVNDLDMVTTTMDQGVAPAAIFGMGPDDFILPVERKSEADEMFEQLPLYTPAHFSEGREGVVEDLFKEPVDSPWQTDLVPVTKYATTKITTERPVRPRRRSRYDYHDEEEDDNEPIPVIPPEWTDCALFHGKNRVFRERLHPPVAFRSPIDTPMPRFEFYESRQSSLWTPAEDDELRALVKEFSFNWAFVSSCLSGSAAYVSASRPNGGPAIPRSPWEIAYSRSATASLNHRHTANERRSSWECFERWLMLEQLPPEVSQHPAFIRYFAMIKNAQQRLIAAHQAVVQQQQAKGRQIPQGLMRVRTNEPQRVEHRHSPSRTFLMFDAMRRLAKKRETNYHKLQQAVQVAAQRKVAEANQQSQQQSPSIPISTPQELSRMKHERELKQQEQFRQQQIAHQRAAWNHRLQQQQLQQHGQTQIPGPGGSRSPHTRLPSGMGVNVPAMHPAAGMGASPQFPLNLSQEYFRMKQDNQAMQDQYRQQALAQQQVCHMSTFVHSFSLCQ